MKTASITLTKFITTPSVTAVTPTLGAAGAYSYKLVAVDSQGGKTAASVAGSTAAGPTTLDATHFNTITWTDPVGSPASILVYRTAGGATQGLIGTVAAGVQTLVDNGLVGDASTPSASNTTGFSAPVSVSELKDLTLQVDGTFVATMQLQGKIDGASGFVNVGAAQSAAGFLDLTATVKTLSQVRVSMTAYTSGTPFATVGGH